MPPVPAALSRSRRCPAAGRARARATCINCYARKVGKSIRWQRVPGARRFTTGDGTRTDLPPDTACRSSAPRGQLVVDNYLLSVWGDKVARTLADGTRDGS